MPKYPEITVKLTGHDGNAFAILGTCLLLLRQHGLSDKQTAFFKEATSSDYQHLLQVVYKWFNVG